MIRRIASALLSLVVAASAVSVTVHAEGHSQGSSQAKPEQKPEPKPEATPATPAGKWSMNIETQGGARQATLDIKIEVKKVTGTLASEIGETPIAGEFAEGRLTFAISFDANGQLLNIKFTGTTQKDGSLAGTATMEGAEMTWTATRVKG